MTEPYAIERPDEIYVPWGRPADLGPVPGIQGDALEAARAALGLMVERVTFEADATLGMILWEATARLRRLEEKIGNTDMRYLHRWREICYPSGSHIRVVREEFVHVPTNR